MNKRMVTFLLLFQFSFCLLQAQTTAIPDPNFEQALIDRGIDSDSTINGLVLTSDIKTVTDLNVFNYDIVSLSGIQDFDSLVNLNCSNNQIKNIDLSNLSKLKDLNCASNLLSTLNISSNINLEKLNCQDNLLPTLDISENILLKTLDFTSNRISIINTAQNDSLLSLKGSNNQLISLSVGNNTLLEELACSNNQIDSLNLQNNKLLRTLLAASNHLDSLNLSNNDSLNFVDVTNNQLRNLDVSHNLLLTNLSCSKNQLSTLNLTANDSLTFLGISNNQIKSIEVGANKKLQHLIGASNQIMALDVSENIDLTSIDVSMNLISNLDLSANDSLTTIDVSKNQLRSLNIKNGYNDKITTFNSTNNQELLCILVDDTSATGHAWLKDDIAGYNEVCNALTYLPDDDFEQALIDLGFDTGPLDNYVLTANIDTLKLLDIAGKGIRDLTGLEDFVALTTLDCSNNLIYNLGVNSLEKLKSLNCSDNDSLGDLDLKGIQDSLVILNATMNPLLLCISVDDVALANNSPNWIKDSTAAYNLDCNSNKTYIPDNNFEQALIDLGYDNGSLDNYVVTDSIKNIRILDVSNRNISDLTGIEDFIALDSLNCSLNKLTSLDVSRLDSLRKLSCFGNYLSELDITSNDSLLQLICGDNRLTNLDVTKNTALLQLVCDANDLTKLDLSNNLNLLSLNCGSNYITNEGLLLDSNVYLIQLICPNNKLTSIDITKNVWLADLDCSGNNISMLNLSENVLIGRLNCSLNKLSNLDVAHNDLLISVECNSNHMESLDFTNNHFLRNLSADNNQLNDLIISGNDSLRILSVAGNKLTTLDVSNNLLLNYLNGNDNHLPSLDVSMNDSLTFIAVSGNEISTLNTNNLSLLQYLNCGNNKMDSLDISANKQLLELHIPGNHFESINLDSNKSISVLDISNNAFALIDLTEQNALVNLNSSGNQLKTLALQNNTILKSVNLSSNQLESLNVQNGNNDSLATFITINNPDLRCIEVDDPNHIGANWQKDSIATYNSNCHYNDTYIPDDNFEKALSAITGQTDNNDNYILTASIDTLQFLDISGRNISDLTGIQDFSALQILYVQNNLIDSLSLSNSHSLKELNASSNQLSALDLSNNKMLVVLELASNHLTSIATDSLPLLTKLNVDSNQLNSLMLKNNPALTSLSTASNQLTGLSVNNGNNTILTTFNSSHNDQFLCIEVDDPTAANAAPGWQKDSTATYSMNCHYNQVYVPDDAFEQALIDAGYEDPGVATLDNYVPDKKILTATSLYLKDKGIKDLTGLQAFVNLTHLNIENNDIDTLDLSHHPKLEQLYCSNNNLTGLDVSGNDSLRRLSIDNNPISTIDLQNNILLIIFSASHTNLSKISLGNNPNLERLTATNNKNLLAIDIQNGNNNQLKNVDVRFNALLNCILVDNMDTANSNSNWLKDATVFYKLICADDDNDGVPNDEDHCPATPFGDQVDLFGCSIYTLPANNFNVIVSDETCRSSDNGMINISAVKMENYKATIEVDGKVREYNFTDSLEIRDIRAGTYELCITINGKPTYRNCYTIVIKQPTDLSVIPRTNPGRNEVTLELSGGKNYTIELNGAIFKTTHNSIQLKLTNGINNISVKTDKLCQGVYEQRIFTGRELVFYPNPFTDQFTIYIGKDVSKKAIINIYSYSGQLALSTIKTISAGLTQLNAATLSAGFYTVSVNTGTNQYTFKIVKK